MVGLLEGLAPQTLTIKNFTVIKHAELQIKKINIIIGPQAQGKSLVAKILYFIKSIQTHYINALRRRETIGALANTLKQEFEKRFPRYSWEGTEFTVTYKHKNLEISITGVKNNKNKTTLSIELCSDLKNEFNKRRRLFNKEQEKILESGVSRKPSEDHESFFDCVVEPLKIGEFSTFFNEPVFIPASRTFFANLQKNIFTFLSSNVNIDPYLKDFGSSYERAKSFHRSSYLKSIPQRDEILRSMEAIIDGEYEFKDDQDWIKNKERKINLSHASSGQQESLPMLLTLATLPYVFAKSSVDRMFFIEEPEAHLFPTSQALIMSILSSLNNQLGMSFFITTHSPYILSALNNLILAHDAVLRDKISLKEFQKINKSGYPISSLIVSAYTMHEGTLQNIIDEDLGIVGADMLDVISEHFEKVTNHLLCLG